MIYNTCLWLVLGSLSISPLFVEAVDTTSTNKTNTKGPALKADFQSDSHQKYTIPADYQSPESSQTDNAAQLEVTVKEELDQSYPDNDFDISVDGSTVMLTGKVKSEELKKRIEAQVKEIEGVDEVENNLQVTK